MFRFLKEYFSLTNNEQRGVIGLMLIILLVFGGTRTYLRWQPAQETPQDNKELIALLNKTELVPSYNSKSNFNATSKPKVSYFNFDPNSASEEELLALGFKENVASTLINFRSKGGKFYQKEDLKKVYGIDDNFYTQIEPYISIAPKVYPKQKNEVAYEKNITPKKPLVEEKIYININTADSASLTQVKGIGPAFSSRIIKYRNLLGGFNSAAQVLEVYGITQEVYDGIKAQIFVEGGIKKLKVNELSWYDLKNHPYIDSELANLLLNYKKAHGNLENFDFLLANKLISQEKFDKLTPYLSVEK